MYVSRLKELLELDMDKKRFRTPLLTPWNHFENRPSTILNFLEHLQLSHTVNLCLVRPDKGRVIVESFSQIGQMFDESSYQFLLHILSLENILRIFRKYFCCIYFRMRIFLHTVGVSRIAQFLKF